MKLSIIIVNYNTYDLTKQTIESVQEQQLAWPYEIMLVDNASADGSIEALQEDFRGLIAQGIVKVFCNGDNLGFSKANNIGIRESKGKYVLLLNSDTYLAEGALEKCMAYIEAANREQIKVGALGCKIVLPDGTLDHACKRGFPTPQASLYYFLGLHKKNPQKYGAYMASHLGEDQVGEVECLMGAFMLMPRSVLNHVGFLDEDFFMYGEDIDLCYRIGEGGYRIVYYPEAQLIHYKGGSSKKRRTKIIYDFHDAMWLFYKKHYKVKYHRGITCMVYIGIWTKYGLAILKNSMKK
ncbi:MAG: glycosyltransferase family 2 protein [Cellulosilyticaceae bacterium]